MKNKMQWLITYITRNDHNAPRHTQTITAATYTSAYLIFAVKYNGIILEIKKI